MDMRNEPFRPGRHLCGARYGLGAYAVLLHLAVVMLAAPVAAQDGNSPRVAITRSVSLSVTDAVRKKISEAVELLPERLQGELVGSGKIARIAKPLSADYVPPSDDDLSFNMTDGGDTEIANRVSAAFAPTPDPLVLLTVAERGPYLILAGYIARDLGGGIRAISRVYRKVVPSDGIAAADLDDQVACMASKIAKAVDAPAAGTDPAGGTGPDPACDAPVKTAAAKPAAAPKTGSGLLEGVAENEGEIQVVTPETRVATVTPPDPPKKVLPRQPPWQQPTIIRPSEPTAVPSCGTQTGTACPAPGAKVGTVAPPASIQHLSPAAPGVSPQAAEVEMIRDIFKYGVIWKTKDRSKIALAKSALAPFLGSGWEAACFKKKSEAEAPGRDVADMILKYMREVAVADDTPIIRVNSDYWNMPHKHWFWLKMAIPRYQPADFRVCLADRGGHQSRIITSKLAIPREIPRYSYRVLPWLKSLEMPFPAVGDALEANQGWRLPQGVEAFFVAEGIAQGIWDRRHEEHDFQSIDGLGRFWFKIGDQDAIFDRSRREYEILRSDGGNKRAAIILVQQRQTPPANSGQD